MLYKNIWAFHIADYCAVLNSPDITLTDITDMTLIIRKQLNITSTSDIATRYFTVFKKEILTDTHFPPFTTNNNS